MGIHECNKISVSAEQDIAFSEFADRFSSGDLYVQIHDFLHLKKEKYADGKVNMVNYVATSAEGKLKGEEEAALTETFNNFSAVVVEQPLAEVSKREIREYKWKTCVLPDGREQLRLISSFGDLDTVLEEALYSSQPADFEYERYQANLNNYRALQKARERGDTRTFVEFSPSPELTPEAKARGYFGMDAIFIYTYDKESHKEIVEQRWLKAQKKDFWDLIGGLEGQQYMYLSDSGIMNRSQFVNEEEREMVDQFIDDKNGKFVSQPALDIYKHDVLTPKIRKMAEPIVELAAKKMILGIPIQKELEELEATGAYLQYLLREKIKELLGVNKTYITISLEEKNLIENDTSYRAMFVEKNKKKMPLAGCGGNNEEDSNGKTAGMLDVFKDEHGALKFKCPICKGIHERPRGELLSVCVSSRPEYRGRSIPRC